MNVLSILGSPRKQGNTAYVLGWVEDELRRLGHTVERIDIVDHEVGGCRECFACQKKPREPGCSVKDEGNAIFERMIGADAVIFATPVFCWGPTAQLKAVFDRMFCLTDGESFHLLRGKPTALVATAGGDYDHDLRFVSEAYRSLMTAEQVCPVGELCVPGCSTPERMCGKTREEAYALAQAIARVRE